ncbi:unnamed protein product, partial [Dibothriocephalus latus]
MWLEQPFEMAVPLCWMLILNFAMALTPPKLNLYLEDIDELCWPEGKVYDIFDTIMTTVDYAAAHTNGQLESKDVDFALTFVSGCSLVEAKHVSSVISFLRDACSLANSSAGYSVFLGPILGSNCHSVTDWIALGAVPSGAQSNLYQISYLCQDIESFRLFEKVQTCHSDKIFLAVNIRD